MAAISKNDIRQQVQAKDSVHYLSSTSLWLTLVSYVHFHEKIISTIYILYTIYTIPKCLKQGFMCNNKSLIQIED